MLANDQGIALLGRVCDAGAEAWWFDGDRPAAFRAWQDENGKVPRNMIDQHWHNVVGAIDANDSALEAFSRTGWCAQSGRSGCMCRRKTRLR